jgi:hypothetical protein
MVGESFSGGSGGNSENNNWGGPEENSTRSAEPGAVNPGSEQIGTMMGESGSKTADVFDAMEGNNDDSEPNTTKPNESDPYQLSEQIKSVLSDIEEVERVGQKLTEMMGAQQERIQDLKQTVKAVLVNYKNGVVGYEDKAPVIDPASGLAYGTEGALRQETSEEAGMFDRYKTEAATDSSTEGSRPELVH